MSDVVAKVEELAQLLEEHQLTAIKVKQGELAIELRRDPEPVHHHASQAVGAIAGNGAAIEGAVIPSPMAGVYYGRPSPGEDPFVQPGERVSSGQVVAIIEAMKVFNEVLSPLSGVISKMLVEDGAVVAEGDPLYLLES